MNKFLSLTLETSCSRNNRTLHRSKMSKVWLFSATNLIHIFSFLVLDLAKLCWFALRWEAVEFATAEAHSALIWFAKDLGMTIRTIVKKSQGASHPGHSLHSDGLRESRYGQLGKWRSNLNVCFLGAAVGCLSYWVAFHDDMTKGFPLGILQPLESAMISLS